MGAYPSETFQDKLVTYTLELDGRLYLIENVPAKVCLETGEQLFSPATVEHIQAIIKEPSKPYRVIEAPVYDFSA